MIRKWKRWLLGWLILCVTVVSAQNATCPDLVESALEIVDQVCNDLGRNEACYGNFMLEASFKPGTSDIQFTQAGDLASVQDIQSLELGSLDEQSEVWGVAVLSLQANIPDTLPGQNVTFVLIGDVSIENAATDEQNPMEAFYLRTGVGDASCAEAPESGLLVQTPDGIEEVAFNVNGVDVSIGSTAFFQAVPEEDLVVTTVEGTAVLDFDGELFPVIAGTRLRTRLGADLLPIERPRLPESYELFALGSLPLRLLERRIEIADPLDPEKLELLRETVQNGEVPCDVEGFPSCERLQRFVDNRAGWADSNRWGTRFIPGENCRLPGTEGRLPLCPAREIAPRIVNPEFREELRERRCDQYAPDQLPAFCQSLTLDRDGDGIVDGEDRCPDEAGLREYFGCNPSDSDGDGVVDPLDLCPREAGLPEYRGCNPPDSDGDGVIDLLDRCPREAGLREYRGCNPPDSDGDGVVDPLDRCPNQAGLPRFDGCIPPDSDGDGVYDPVDRCPNQPGRADYQGCMPPDSDGDGVVDPEDRCPNQPGPAEYQGCNPPDGDRDGVPDALDRCPNRPGPASNGGCPLPTPTPGA